MKIRTLFRLIANGQASLGLGLLKTANEFYRACFISAALSQGIYDRFFEGKSTLEQLCKRLDLEFNHEGLRAWLELGVSLGELKRVKNEYRIQGKLSKALVKPNSHAYRALLEEIVKYHYGYVKDTPAMIQEQRWFPFDPLSGELIARSSRVSEPFIFEAVDKIIPPHENLNLLEVGCGTGIYIQRACALNPLLRAVGLELQQRVANIAKENMSEWGLEDRVTIEHCDVRNYTSDQKFDLITLHQNIYYFSKEERVDLARHLIAILRPGGKILLTTICQGGGPGVQALNVWVSTTQGYGPLPHPDELCQQFKEAGFAEVKRKRLIPFESFWAFVAKKPL